MTAPGPITTNYGYDYENRLASVSNPSYTAAYTYSADGLRLRAQESNHPYPDRWFLYAGALPFCEGTLSGDTYTWNKLYIREGLSYYDPLVFSSVGGYRRHYLYDGLGSTRQLLNDAQTTTDTYTYEAFGNSMGSTGTTANPYKYVGSLGYYSPTAAGGSSLQHLGARYYMPEIGRFTSPDPDQSVDDPLSLYAYCGSRPTGCVDADGEEQVPFPFDPYDYDDWILRRMFGDVSRYHEYLSQWARDYGSCWADCMCPLGQLAEQGAVEAAKEATKRGTPAWYSILRHLRFPRKSSIYRRLVGVGTSRAAVIKEAGLYATGAQGLYCYVKCANPADEYYVKHGLMSPTE